MRSLAWNHWLRQTRHRRNRWPRVACGWLYVHRLLARDPTECAECCHVFHCDHYAYRFAFDLTGCPSSSQIRVWIWLDLLHPGCWRHQPCCLSPDELCDCHCGHLNVDCCHYRLDCQQNCRVADHVQVDCQRVDCRYFVANCQWLFCRQLPCFEHRLEACGGVCCNGCEALYCLWLRVLFSLYLRLVERKSGVV